MQFLCNKNLGKIGCSAVLKALTSNNDIRIELHRENSYNRPTKSRFSLPMRCIFRYTRTLLVALSLACLEMSFNVKGPGAVILLFRLGYKTSVVCHNVYTQKVKIARRDRLHILASNRCETFENLLHIDIAPLRSTLSGILHSKN